MKPFKVAATFGRFNLLHNGHIHLFLQMFEQAEEVYIGLSTGPNNLDVLARKAVIEKALADEDIKFQVMPLRNPYEVFDIANTVHGLDTLCYFGEDQIKLSRSIEKSFGFECRLNPRIASSTLVRSLIDNEEWDILSDIVPGSIIGEVTELHLLSKQNNA